MKLAPGLVLGAALAAAVIACAGAPRAAKTAPAPEAGAPSPAAASGDPHAQIEVLDREIAAELSRAKIAPPAAASCTGASCATAMSQPFATPSVTDPACHPAPGDQCHDACTLATSICRNQERICELAKQLAGDDWAAGKCTTARASCQAAHDRCCSCVL